MTMRGTAHAVALSVWQNSVAPLRGGGRSAPPSPAARGLGLRAVRETGRQEV
jgi:hypothetical protein